ncbi:MAG: hypothetical protein AAF471_04020 [Myxococcota bacterium]
MGLLGSLWGGRPTAKAISKQATLAKDPYVQSEYRMAAMNKLLKWQTKESLLAVLGRFAVVAQSPHWDEEEKVWLKDQLSQRGELAKETIVEFMRSTGAITHPAQVLSRLCSDQEEFVRYLKGALTDRPPEDYRSAQAKRELILALQATEVGHAIDCVTVYLADQSDDVRCTAIDAVRARGNPALQKQLVGMLADDKNSPRVLRHAASAVSELRLPVGSELQLQLAQAVAQNYRVEGGKLKAMAVETGAGSKPDF